MSYEKNADQLPRVAEKLTQVSFEVKLCRPIALYLPASDIPRAVDNPSVYFATKPASFINEALSLSSSSRNCTMSLPVRKIGFSACFSM